MILKLDLHMVKLYLYTENEVPSCCSSKVAASTDRHMETQTNRQTELSEIITYLHVQMVKMNIP